MIAFVLFTSSPAEAGKFSVIKKILDKVVDLLKGKPTVKKKSGDEGGNIYNLGEEGAGIIYDLDEDGARKRLESNRDEEKKAKGRTESGNTLRAWTVPGIDLRRYDRDIGIDEAQQRRRDKIRAQIRNSRSSPRRTEIFEDVQTKPKNRDKHLLFLNQRSAREAVKCQDGDPKMVIGYGASVYARPDLESSILGKYEPNERVCVTSQTLGWKMTLFGWLEEKSIF